MDFSKVKPQLSKLRGQHFLTDKNIVAKIILASELQATDDVVEVGPGLGVLTGELIQKVNKLTAVELDPLFVFKLRELFADEEKLKIIEADILKLKISDLVSGKYKLVTNLPYNITSAFLKKFLVEQPYPERIVVMIQKEVAERITSASTKVKNEELIPDGVLAFMCNLYADCSWVCKVGPGAFSPPPKVDSAVICLKPYSDEQFLAKWGIAHSEAEQVIAFASRFFGSSRKKMSGLLPKPLAEKLRNALTRLGESPDSRPAVLSVKKWVDLWKLMQ